MAVLDDPSETSSPSSDGKPDAFTRMKLLAQAGNLAGLLDAITKDPAGAGHPRRLKALLRYGIGQASKQSPKRFMRSVYRESLAFIGYVQMRLHACAVISLADAPMGPLSNELGEKVLPDIERMMRLMKELGQTWAATERLWGLARRRRRLCDLNDVYADLVNDGVLPFAGEE